SSNSTGTSCKSRFISIKIPSLHCVGGYRSSIIRQGGGRIPANFYLRCNKNSGWESNPLEPLVLVAHHLPSLVIKHTSSKFSHAIVHTLYKSKRFLLIVPFGMLILLCFVDKGNPFFKIIVAYIYQLPRSLCCIENEADCSL